MWSIPLVLKAQTPPPSRTINHNDPAIVYQGAWTSVPKPAGHYHGGDVHASKGEGNSLELTFEGTGIELISEKFSDLGQVEIFLDNESRGIVNLALENFPRLTGVVVFSKLLGGSSQNRTRPVRNSIGDGRRSSRCTERLQHRPARAKDKRSMAGTQRTAAGFGGKTPCPHSGGNPRLHADLYLPKASIPAENKKQLRAGNPPRRQPHRPKG